jgi:hypothetical protein
MSRFLSDFVTIDELAKDLGRHPRTLIRWTQEPDGLPFTSIGKQKFVHIPAWQAWVMSRMKQRNPVRPRRKR